MVITQSHSPDPDGKAHIALLAIRPAVIRIGPSGSTTVATSTLEAVRQVGELGFTALEVN